MADFKLDIFQALAAADKRDDNWLERQPEEVKKGFAAPVFLRWAATVASGNADIDRYMLMHVNDKANITANDYMGAHPDLLFRLVAACGLGQRLRHEWLPMPGRMRVSNAARDLMMRFHPHASDREIDLLMSIHTRGSFEQFVEDTGISTKEAKEALKAYDARKSGRTEGAKKKPSDKNRG